jgi:hypothetical protein
VALLFDMSPEKASQQPEEKGLRKISHSKLNSMSVENNYIQLETGSSIYQI